MSVLYYFNSQVVPPSLPPPLQKSIAIPARPHKTIAELPPRPIPPPPPPKLPMPPPKPPPPASGSSSPMTEEEQYHAAVAGVQPAKPNTANGASAPPPAKSPASDEDGYESWPGTTAKDDDIGDKLYEDFPTPKNEEEMYNPMIANEEEIYKKTDDLVTKPSLQNQLHPDYSTEEEEEDEEDEEDEEEEDEEEEEDPYQEFADLVSDQQKKSLQSLTEDKQDMTASGGKDSYEREDYHPSTDNDSAHSDYLHQWIPHDKEKSYDSIPKGTGKPPLEPPMFSTDGVEVRNSANMTTEVTNKHDEVAKRLQDPSTSDTTVSELRQSLVAEEDGNAKTQKSTKAHEFELKDLNLKYKTEMKQLQLKQEEETLAMKVEINKLKSELNGVYKQNSKLAEHVKKSCKREEMFNQVVTLLQDTVSDLQTEMNELLATLESTKEKLKKYESMDT